MQRFDFAVHDDASRLVAIVEVRPRRGTDAQWAAQLRRNMLSHGPFPEAPFFLVVTLDRVYLWRDAGTEAVEVVPTHILDTKSLFAPYFEGTRIGPDRVSAGAFELVVASWLADLSRSSQITGKALAAQEDLLATGLLSALRGGQVAYQSAA